MDTHYTTPMHIDSIEWSLYVKKERVLEKSGRKSSRDREEELEQRECWIDLTKAHYIHVQNSNIFFYA